MSKTTSKMMLIGAFALLIAAPAAFAQTPEASVLPVTEPLDVGGTILQPGTYTIRVLPSMYDRNKIQVTSMDGNTVYATALTVPHPLEPNEEVPNTVFVFYPAGEGSPRALRTWFAKYPDASQGGHDIIYDETRARQLARIASSRVVSYPVATTVEQRDTATLSFVTPESTIEVYEPPTPIIAETRTTTTITREPMVSSTVDMPATASNTPLIALLGLVALFAAIAVRVVRA
jgi:hypothetical protein